MKKNNFKLSILIPSMPSRFNLLSSLLKSLQTQITKDVEVLISIDNKVKMVGEKRNELLKQAQGEYIVFIDDDDFVPFDYIDEVLRAINDSKGVDYISYGQRFHNIQTGQKNTVLSRIGAKRDMSKDVYIRGVLHTCLVKRSLAVKFPEDRVFGEDTKWGEDMDKICKTEYLINKILYFYEWKRIKNDD